MVRYAHVVLLLRLLLKILRYEATTSVEHHAGDIITQLFHNLTIYPSHVLRLLVVAAAQDLMLMVKPSLSLDSRSGTDRMVHFYR